MDKGKGQLHQHRWHERKKERESLPDLVPSRAVCGAQVESSRGLGGEERDRHKYRAGQSHPHTAIGKRGIFTLTLHSRPSHAKQETTPRWRCAPPTNDCGSTALGKAVLR